MDTVIREPVTRHITIPHDRVHDVFLLADFHFDHTNIIGYCKRPFADSVAMNEYMLTKYNSVVRSDSLFIFLGDMTFGRASRGARFWLTQLHGEIIYLKGSHDEGIRSTSVDLQCSLVCDVLYVHTTGANLLCIHAPERAPAHTSWVIHGHHHNNNLEIYPHINRQNKTMNLSAELIDYTPVSLAYVLSQINKQGE